MTNEFTQAQYTYPGGKTDVAVGDLGCAESRLVSNVKELRGVVFLASHPMEPLWVSDGIQYHTVVISPAIEPSKTLASQLSAACTFLRSHQPALVCSSCPRLPALVLAAYRHYESGGRVPIRTTLADAQDALDLSPGDVSAADLSELDTFAALLEPPAGLAMRMVPPPPPSTSPAEADDGEESDDRAQEEEEEVVDNAVLTTPRLTGKRGAPLTAILSSDSTLTQIDAELAGAETPTAKKARVPASIGKASPPVATTSGGGKRGNTHEKKRPRTVQDVGLSRGDCTRCAQENVLGWTRMGAGSFECCACHDSHDDEDDE